MPTHPLAEVFGFPADNLSAGTERYRNNRLCPYNNRVPSCTKDKANDPLGVCSIYDDEQPVITCPVRFRQDWLIAEDAARFFFPPETRWTSLTEVRLNDRNGRSAGNIDVELSPTTRMAKFSISVLWRSRRSTSLEMCAYLLQNIWGTDRRIRRWIGVASNTGRVPIIFRPLASD